MRASIGLVIVVVIVRHMHAHYIILYQSQYSENVSSTTSHRQAEEDIEFPDEVQTPEDVPARVRFARYR